MNVSYSAKLRYGVLTWMALCLCAMSSVALPASPYSTKVYLGSEVEISLYTPAMFRFRVSHLEGEKFPAQYEIPFVIGKTENWLPVQYRRWSEAGVDFVETAQIQIRIPQNGHSWTVWNAEGKSQIYPSNGPIYGMFRDGYSLFDSTSAFGERNDNSRFAHWFYNPTTGRYVDTYLAGDLIFDQYFIYGPSYDALFRQMNELVGPEPLLPKKAYGFFQTQHLGCAGNQKSLLELANRLRHDHIPADTLIVDYEWGDSCAVPDHAHENEKYWGGLDWSPHYSAPWSPREFLAKLHALHFDVMIIHHSAPDFPHRAEDTPRRKRDWTSQVVEEKLWWEKFRQQLDAGVDGTWQDTRQNDVTDSVIWQSLQKYWSTDRRVLFMGVRNMMWIDPFSFDRDDTIPTNSMIGSRRYPFRWTGDTGMTWAEFRYQISAITGNYGAMDGVTYITADGFANLWQERARWNQFLDFLPVARSHTVKPWDTKLDAPFVSELMDRREHEPISSQDRKLEAPGSTPPPKGATAENSVRKHLQLRYRLLPYLYSYAHLNYATGMPIVRPMFLAFPNDPYCKFNRWPYQFMFGSSLLIAPVYGDLATQEINLPQGSDWIDYWSRKSYPGGSVVAYDTHDVEKLPIFVRAGSIIPVRNDSDWIDPGVSDDPLTLDVYPSPQYSSFDLYEDDGVSTLYQKRQFVTTSFGVQQEQTGNVQVTLGQSLGDYRDKPQSRTYLLDINLIAERPLGVTRAGKPIAWKNSFVALASAPEGWTYDHQQQKVRIKLVQRALDSSVVTISRRRLP